MILDRPWPEDFDPAQAGATTLTIAILRRHDGRPTRLDTLTAEEFLAIETAGLAILANLVGKGNAVIARYENLPPDQRRRHSVIVKFHASERRRLRRLVTGSGAYQVWRRDPRFAHLLPKVDATVAEIATAGSVDDLEGAGEFGTRPRGQPMGECSSYGGKLLGGSSGGGRVPLPRGER